MKLTHLSSEFLIEVHHADQSVEANRANETLILSSIKTGTRMNERPRTSNRAREPQQQNEQEKEKKRKSERSKRKRERWDLDISLLALFYVVSHWLTEKRAESIQYTL